MVSWISRRPFSPAFCNASSAFLSPLSTMGVLGSLVNALAKAVDDPQARLRVRGSWFRRGPFHKDPVARRALKSARRAHPRGFRMVPPMAALMSALGEAAREHELPVSEERLKGDCILVRNLWAAMTSRIKATPRKRRMTGPPTQLGDPAALEHELEKLLALEQELQGLLDPGEVVETIQEASFSGETKDAADPPERQEVNFKDTLAEEVVETIQETQVASLPEDEGGPGLQLEPGNSATKLHAEGDKGAGVGLTEANAGGEATAGSSEPGGSMDGAGTPAPPCPGGGGTPSLPGARRRAFNAQHYWDFMEITKGSHPVSKLPKASCYTAAKALWHEDRRRPNMAVADLNKVMSQCGKATTYTVEDLEGNGVKAKLEALLDDLGEAAAPEGDPGASPEQGPGAGPAELQGPRASAPAEQGPQGGGGERRWEARGRPC